MIREENHIFLGMKRGRHQINQEKGFLWDAHNIRITDKEDNTLFSITNEKGTSDPLVTLNGKYVGHCVLNELLIVFTSSTEEVEGEIKPKDCYIYKVIYSDGLYRVRTLFYRRGIWDNGWSPENPIETLGVYESSLVLKVYWVDGRNQPRVINVVKEGAIYNDYSFDFVQTLQLNETVEVQKFYGEGMFTPGTIQYAFTYYNKYAQESNIFYTTPLQYISFKDRGGEADELVSNSFQIKVTGLDNNFEYVRIYAIHRSSLDAVPEVRLAADLQITGSVIQYVDSGTSGETVDPLLLLYIGGREITASTICAKDQTLFLGDITMLEGSTWNEVKDKVTNTVDEDNWIQISSEPIILPDDNGRQYSYTSTIDTVGFKSNETYRCGILFQHKSGIWSEPIWLKDDVLNTVYPRIDNTTVLWYSLGVVLDNQLSLYIKERGYIKARACVVFPNKLDRDVLCQGVLCPTLYSVGGRNSGVPYAMSSWMFRATPSNYNNNEDPSDYKINVYKGSQIEYRHNRPLFGGPNRGAEIQCMTNKDVSIIDDITSHEQQSNYYFIDSNIVTMHSPDVSFDNYFGNLALDSTFELKILGEISQDAVYGDISIIASTPPRHAKASGFVHKTEGYQTGDTVAYELGINGGLVSGLFYNDTQILQYSDTGEDEKDSKTWTGSPIYHMVYLWHRTGSLNNDSSQSSTKESIINSAILDKKKIANLKFFDRYSPLPSGLIINYEVVQPRVFNYDQVIALKLWIPYLGREVIYYGNQDTMAITSTDHPYDLYTGTSFNSSIDKIPEHALVNGKESDVMNTSSDPVRIKFKSTPHLVFSLSKSGSNSIPILPVRVSSKYDTPEYKLPDWDTNNSTKYSWSSVENGVVEISLIGSATSMTGTVYKESDLLRSLIGTFRYCSDNSNKNYNRAFIKCEVEGTPDTSNSGTSWAGAKAVVKEGTIFKIIGDGKSCNVVKDDLKVLGDFYKGSPKYYTGETKYFKAVNVEISSSGNIVKADLEEISAPGTDTDTPDLENPDKEPTEVKFSIQQDYINNSDLTSPTILLAELRRKPMSEDIKFGGASDSAKRNNVWLPAGEPVKLSTDGDTVVRFTNGDTWYSRYDCLKTYPFTQEDENQVIEVGSFMCETRINIDGRCDKNRGTLSNLAITPLNFNLLNGIYSQKDNFFNYKILDEDFYKTNKYANQIAWSLEKMNAAEIDNWTKVTVANVLDMDGTKGRITALKSTGDTLLCFQEKAFSQLLFNSRVLIPVSDGVPIEITNSYKMEGYRLVSENIGCSNKWSVVSTDKGIYFIDNQTNSFYLYKDQVHDISRQAGMDWWFIKNNPGIVWSPLSKDKNGMRSFIDFEQGDIYISPGTMEQELEALCFSEKLSLFTSQMSYGGVQAMFNFNDGFYSLKDADNGLILYKNNAGKYNNFFGKVKGWRFSFISNDKQEQQAHLTKVFDSLELKTDHYNNRGELLNTCPINFIGASNEYQEGLSAGQYLNIRKKFRVWRGLLPRVSEVADMHNKGLDIKRYSQARARLRNPWAMITVGWDPAYDKEDQYKNAIIHDMTVRYTV